MPPIAAASPSNMSHAEQSATAAESHKDSQEEDDEWLVSCRCESAKSVSTLLSCLQHVSSGSATGESTAREMSQNRRGGRSTSAIQPVTVFCSPTSLTFHVSGKAKQTQASVDMQAGLFSDYRVDKQQPENGSATTENWQAGGEFCVNLTTVLECLHVLGTQSLDRTKLCFSYNLTKEIFKMELLEDSGVLSTAAIPGMIAPEDDLGHSLALAFRSSPIAARFIVKSEVLREVIHELELLSGATCGTVALGADGLEMAVVGHIGECLVSVPAKGSHVVSLEVPNRNEPAQARTYPLHNLLGSMRGLEIAEETCITMNNDGMMAIQHQVIDQQVGDGNPNFVDFIMCCLEEEEDDEGNVKKEEEEQSTFGQQSTQESPRSLGWTQTQVLTANQRVTQEEPRSAKSSRSVVTSRHSDDDYDDDGDEDDDEESNLPAVSNANLFGTVVRDTSATSSSYGRRNRRPTSSSSRRRVEDDNDSDASPNLLASSEDEEHEEETQPLDITAPASPRYRREEREDCSSPELVYGRQQ